MEQEKNTEYGLEKGLITPDAYKREQKQLF